MRRGGDLESEGGSDEGKRGKVGEWGGSPRHRGCPYPPRGACSGMAGEVVRRRRARAVARTVERKATWWGVWATWPVGLPCGLRPRGAVASWASRPS